MKNKITDLNNMGFEMLDRLMDTDLDLDTEVKRAEAFAGVAQVVINAAKAETDRIKALKIKTNTGELIPIHQPLETPHHLLSN